MAADTETLKILDISVDGAVKSIGDLKENIKNLKKQLEGWKETTDEVDESGKKVIKTHEGLTIGTEEYQKVLNELKLNQNALKDAMYATSASMEDVIQSAQGAGETYNALVHRMAAMKEELRNTDVSTEEGKKRFNELAEQISEVNTKLKEMDAAQGNYQRNVGNYESALNKLSDKFKVVAGGASGIINPIANVTKGLNVMSATPVIGILGLLANILSKVMANLNSSEESTNRMTKAMGVFGGVTETITKILQGLGNAVTWVIEGMSKLYVSIFGETDAMKARNKIAEDSIALAKQERENTIANADAEREIAEYREKATDKERYTAAQRLEFQKKAGELENQIAERAKEDLKTQYEIIKAKNALTQSSAEDLQKEADAYAAMVKAETEYLNKVASNNKQLESLRKEQAREAKEAAKEAQDALKARLNAEKELISQELELTEEGSAEQLRLQKERRKKEYDLAVAEAKTKIKNASDLNKTLMLLQKKYDKDLLILERNNQKSRESQQILHLQNLADIYENGTREYLTAIRDLRKQEMDNIQREEGETIDQFNARRLQAQKAYYDSLRALNEKSIQESTAELRLALAKQEQGSEGYYAGMMSLAENYWRNLTRNAGESEVEFAIRQAEAFKAYQDAVQTYLDYGTEQERLSLENRMNALKSGSVAYLDAAVELKKYELDTLHQLEGESNEEFRSRQIEAQKAYDDAIKESIQGRINLMQSSISIMSGIFANLESLYEGDAENSLASARKLKNVKIAQAVLNTISGAVGAFTQASETIPPPMGQIVGAASAASVTAAGMAQISKIKSTQIGMSGISANVSAPVIPTDVQQVRNLTSASEEVRLNQMASDQRVVLVMSDLEAKQGQIKVQVEESSF